MIDDDGRSTTRLVFSLTVTSRELIPEFDDLPAVVGVARGREGFSYEFGLSSSVALMHGDRGHALAETVGDALDRVDATGIDPAELALDGRVVTARFSVSPGSESLPTALVRRLARVHATILFDSWG